LIKIDVLGVSMLDRESSLRLSLLRFPLIVGVVFVHAYSNTVGFAGGDIVVSQPNFVVDFVRNFVSQGVARIAVPLFFLMSGYLFFMGFEWSKESYLIKLQSRVKTLLIPFLFWNIATLLVTAIIQVMPATRMFLSGKNLLVMNYSFFDYLNAIIGFNTNPISYQFWFIRDLMIFVLFVPLINLINKTFPIPFLGILLCCWLIGLWMIDIPSLEGLLFFSVGAYLGSIQKSLFSLDHFGVIVIGLYLVLAVVDALTINQVFNPYLHKVSIMLGVSSALFSTKFVAQNEGLKSLIIRLTGVSFFVYAAHEPLLTILKKILYRILSPDSAFTTLFLYFLIPITTIICTIVAYAALARVAPKFVSIITGGR
jgi:surface polysaccharide O-acyltransferase-like enzyme